MLGDWNSRVGDISYTDPRITHYRNPDDTVNSNGRQILKWIEQNQDMLLMNGLKYEDKHFDSDYSFYRGRLMSQNDIAFSNDIKSIQMRTRTFFKVNQVKTAKSAVPYAGLALVLTL